MGLGQEMKSCSRKVKLSAAMCRTSSQKQSWFSAFRLGRVRLQPLKSSERRAASYPRAELHIRISVMVCVEMPTGWQRFSLGELDARSTAHSSSWGLLSCDHIFTVWGIPLQPPPNKHPLPTKPLEAVWDDLPWCVSLPSSAPPQMTLDKPVLLGALVGPTQLLHCITQGRRVLAMRLAEDWLFFPPPPASYSPLEDLTRCEKSKCDYIQLQMTALVCSIACWCLLGITVQLKIHSWI